MLSPCLNSANNSGANAQIAESLIDNWWMF